MSKLSVIIYKISNATVTKQKRQQAAYYRTINNVFFTQYKNYNDKGKLNRQSWREHLVRFSQHAQVCVLHNQYQNILSPVTVFCYVGLTVHTFVMAD